MSRLPPPSNKTPRRAISTASLRVPPSHPVAGRSPSPAKSSALRLDTSRSITPSGVTKSASKNYDPAPVSPTKGMSIKEVIAFKRAEAKKAANAHKPESEDEVWNDGRGVSPVKIEAEDILGRASIAQTIEQAKRNGSLNLTSRSLPCLPRLLFESHLGVTPEPLSLLPTSNDNSKDSEPPVKSSIPSWQAQDLTTLKASDNVIIELQPEISLFGSLKHLDLHGNKLSVVPDSLADLVNLNYLNLSNNFITTLPPNFGGLPVLHTLLIADNALTKLDFDIKESTSSMGNGSQIDSFFAPSITRASEPLPKLKTLNAARNKLEAGGIDHRYIPKMIENIDISSNPLRRCTTLLDALSQCSQLRSLNLQSCDLEEDSFAFKQRDDESSRFPKLTLLDLGVCKLTKDDIRDAFQRRSIEFDAFVTPDGDYRPSDSLRVALGKRVMKEQWELDAEQRIRKSRSRANFREDNTLHFVTDPSHTTNGTESKKPVKGSLAKEDWEVEAEQGLLTEGAKRRARAAVAAVKLSGANTSSASQDSTAKPVVKEAWEIEAEQGLLTEGGRRRARALAATRAAGPEAPGSDAKHTEDSADGIERVASLPSSSSHSLASYFDPSHQSLHLPQALPRAKSHARAISLAARLHSDAQSEGANPLLPSATLPLAKIVLQSFAKTLRTLTLSNRRVNPIFELPSDHSNINSPLPVLDELRLDGCGLSDSITVTHGSSAPSSQSLLKILSSLFPSLSVLDLSHNSLTALTGIEGLLVPDWDTRRKGLKVFRIQGNRLQNLDELQPVCNGWKNDAKIDGWRLEEMDLRANEISKLPPYLGLLPLDVLLVEGNTFRVPARRVWEREGSKGLLQWLKQRIET